MYGCMDRLVRLIWTVEPYRCELHRVEGQLDVRLYAGGRLRELTTCRDSADAEKIAQRWLAEQGA
jgi:hypothetical protein